MPKKKTPLYKQQSWYPTRKLRWALFTMIGLLVLLGVLHYLNTITETPLPGINLEEIGGLATGLIAWLVAYSMKDEKQGSEGN